MLCNESRNCKGWEFLLALHVSLGITIILRKIKPFNKKKFFLWFTITSSNSPEGTCYRQIN